MSSKVADTELPMEADSYKTTCRNREAHCLKSIRAPYIKETFWGRIRGRELDKLGDTLVCKGCGGEYELVGKREEYAWGGWEPGPDRSSWVESEPFDALYISWKLKSTEKTGMYGS